MCENVPDLCTFGHPCSIYIYMHLEGSSTALYFITTINTCVQKIGTPRPPRLTQLLYDFFEINFTRYRDCVPMLCISLILFLDCSSDHWKYEKLLLCYCKAYMVKTAVRR